MKTSFLLPHAFKIPGWVLFVGALATGLILYYTNFNFDLHGQMKVFALFENDILSETTFFHWTETGIFDELLISLILIGGIFVGFSKTKSEDEFIAQIRYESLVWAFYFNAFLILMSTLFIYGMSYFTVMIGNIFSTLVFFIGRFHYKLYQLKRSTHEE
ncbi:MAG: hypothetical protein CFE24_06915 [Flavobacterium sp. BFFFF2]|nr:MAG: hypothetical protein CFE24_06915 [Flavobacterium sp. BFFFF2]